MDFLKQFLNAMLATQSDLKRLIPVHLTSLPHTQEAMMEDFLEKSVYLLDACRAIKQQILDVETSRGMLQAVLSSFPFKNGDLRAAQVMRMQKALARLLHKEFNEIEERQERLYKSFQLIRRESRSEVSGDAPQRWRSWNGSSRSSIQSSTPQASKLLHTMSASLVIPRVTTGKEDEDLCAAVHAVNAASVLVLGIITATFPNMEKTSVPIILIPRQYSWAPSLSQLQVTVQEESKRAGVWELDQIDTIEQRLFDLMDGNDCTLGEKAKEEIKNLLKQLKQYVDELENDLTLIYSQVMDFYNCVISSRMEVLDMLSMLRA
ncbi:hypothetical protein KP509_35G009900 [Ceratopteris richardii]|nr:hypothetical protein KP509_35G009900 [Ceratopteris richardii]